MMTHRSVRDIYEEVAEMQYLKRSVATDVRAKADRSVRDIVEKTLADIEDRGDAAVRELSIKFDGWRSEEHTSELQSLMRISYAVLCLKKKKQKKNKKNDQTKL